MMETISSNLLNNYWGNIFMVFPLREIYYYFEMFAVM